MLACFYLHACIFDKYGSLACKHTQASRHLVEHAKGLGHEAHVAASKALNLGIYVCIFLPDRNNTPGVGFGIKFRRKEEKGFAWRIFCPKAILFTKSIWEKSAKNKKKRFFAPFMCAHCLAEKRSPFVF